MIRPVLLVPAGDVSAFDGSAFSATLNIRPLPIDAEAADLPPVLGVAALGEPEEARAAHAALTAAGAVDADGLLLADDLRSADFWLAARLADYAGRALARSAALSNQLATLRAAHADLEERFETLESYAWTVWRSDRPPAFERMGEAAPGHPGLSALAGECALRQRLESAPRGLSEISVPVAPISDAPAPLEGGGFDAELWLPEENALLASWAVDAEAMARDGAATLILDRALSLRSGTLDLVIRAGCPEDLARLRLGPIGPDPALEARIDGLGPAGGALAMRLWTGPPGLPRRGSAGLSRYAPALPAGWVRASAAPLGEARLAAALRETPAFAPVSYWREHAGVLVHALSGELVIAAVPAPFAKPARAATLEIEHRRADGAPVELAAVIAGDDAAARQALSVAHGQGAPFAGWTRLDPGGAARLHLTASDAAPMSGDLYVAARALPGQGCACAWAILTEILYQPARRADSRIGDAVAGPA